ncbi:MAG: DNA polymerase III subunit beta [Pigmentiphaga sp.]|nr:DNA polymerase III subunit beta [Pigmentiphaga sp.]
MQLVNAPRDTLLKSLTTVAGVVERRHTMPILANVLLQRRGPSLSFIATDNEIQITAEADCPQGEDHATTVAARKFLDILRALPDGVDVSLEHRDSKLSITAGRSRFALQTLPAADFPTVATPEHWSVTLSLPQRTLRNLLGMVHFSMAVQDIRYYLNGMLLVFQPGEVSAVTTDGHRLSLFSVSAEVAPEAPTEIIVPRKTVLELMRLLEDSDEPVDIQVAANQVRFRFGQIEFLSKLVEGKFPDFRRVIPTGYTRHIDVDRDAWLRSLQRIAILTTDKFKGVRLQLESGQLKLSSHNTEQEEASEEIEIDYAGEPLDLGFNVTYLIDVLGNLKDETVRCYLGDANSSSLLTLPESDQFKYVVMPMRI